ncbi:MAG: YlmC/YmxH family sporulation protein [Carboxydocellales bacterium]|jgi:YlmC/YmxH family sporulation protein
MRLSELVGKEVINIYDGARLGVVGESDVIIDVSTGQIESFILPNKGGVLGFWVDKQNLVIPWLAIKKIGSEVIIVEMDQGHPNFNRHHY